MLLPELGFYALPGHTDSPADVLGEVRDAEEVGLGSAFISERHDVKEAATLCGAVAAVTSDLGIATGVTNTNTRHLMVTAAHATTMARLSGGRYALGLGRGFDLRSDVWGIPRVTSASLTDAVGLLRRLWRGERILGHDGPAGRFGYLHQADWLDEEIPVMLAALGPRTVELAGRVFDGLVLHTFFTDDTLARYVQTARRAAETAGRDPGRLRVWAVLAVACDVDEDTRLRYLVARMATYLQAYGDALVDANGWDHRALERFRQHPAVAGRGSAIDATATTEELAGLEPLIPAEWLAASAVGSAQVCARRVLDQFAAGADGVILHASTPRELAPVVEAYRAVRPAGRFAGRVLNPGL